MGHQNYDLIPTLFEVSLKSHIYANRWKIPKLVLRNVEIEKETFFVLIGVETILFEEVKSATDNFNDKRVIGSGASGEVYKGELTLFKTSIPVAVKRLDRARSYGEGAFLKEVVSSHYVHENIITLRGYCEEGDEKIIIMDHAINGSLDMHLHKSTLTWGLQLKISIGDSQLCKRAKLRSLF
nr:protein kinase-like domain, phloem protein 2-like protein [Tanacetum cinerariifolium]